MAAFLTGSIFKKKILFSRVAELFSGNRVRDIFNKVYPFTNIPQCCEEITEPCCSGNNVQFTQVCGIGTMLTDITAYIHGIADGVHSVVFRVSTDNGVSWTTLATVNETFTNGSFTDGAAIDLFAYTNSTVLIGLFVAGETSPSIKQYLNVAICV